MSAALIERHVAAAGEQFPPVDESKLLDYVFAANGTFARGRRPGLEVCIPVSFNLAPVLGLRRAFSYAQWGFPRVPAGAVARMLTASRAACATAPTEALFHLSFDPAGHAPDCRWPDVCGLGWHLECPAQHADEENVIPLESGLGSSRERAIIEVHSHHHGDAYFSPKDNKDASGMIFRVFGVLGSIFDSPKVRVRVALFGHFWECSAREFMELPPELTDCVRE